MADYFIKEAVSIQFETASGFMWMIGFNLIFLTCDAFDFFTKINF